MNEDRRPALGRLVKNRRLSLQMSIDQAADLGSMSPVTWARVEAGENVRSLTFSGVDPALGWVHGAALNYLETGAEPTTRSSPALASGSDTVQPAQSLGPLLADATDAQIATELVNRLASLRKIVKAREVAARAFRDGQPVAEAVPSGSSSHLTAVRKSSDRRKRPLSDQPGTSLPTDQESAVAALELPGVEKGNDEIDSP